MRPRLRWIGAACALLLGAVLGVSPLAAHALFISANIGPGAVVQELPPRLEAVFSQNIGSVELSVTGPDGTVVSGADITKDGNRASVGLRAGGTGVYKVTWSTVSADDGEAARGDWEFGVGAPGGVSPRASVAQEVEGHDEVPWVLIAGGVIVVLVLAGGGFVLYRRRRA